MSDLKGQVAIITGATRGIGRATAELFASHGAALALCSRDQAALDATAQEIAKAHGTRVLGIAADILDAEAMTKLVQRVGEHNIRVNVIALESIVTSQTEKSRQRWAPNATMEEFLAPRNAHIPMHRLGTPEEVAHAIYCLAAPLGAYITGQVLCVDGGGLRSW